MTDIHSHILPGVDDGSKDWDMTIAMCRLAQADGITHVVATPHANYRYQYHRARHADSLGLLREKMPALEFSLGCDFHLSQENIDDALAHPERYIIENTSNLLVEFSDFQMPNSMVETLFLLHCAGFQTIVTHPERNPVMNEYPDLTQQFVDMGAYLQITAGALTGSWGRKAKKTCESLLKKGLVSAIATDAHDLKQRKPILSEAYKVATTLLGKPMAQMLVEQIPGTNLTAIEEQ